MVHSNSEEAAPRRTKEETYSSRGWTLYKQGRNELSKKIRVKGTEGRSLKTAS